MTGSERLSCQDLRNFYVDHLTNTIISFWLREGIDEQRGGFYTCFSNSGEVLESGNKYIWSQGRFLWMLGRMLYQFSGLFDSQTLHTIRAAAENGARFLRDHAVLPNGNAAWVLDETGTPIVTKRDGSPATMDAESVLDLGITADFFLIYGMAEAARALEDLEFYNLAITLFRSVQRRIADGTARSFPHNTPVGYMAHGDPMIMLETAQELASVAAFFGSSEVDELKAIARASADNVINTYIRHDRQVLIEAVKRDGSYAYDELLGSYCNPGHALEDSWFIMHCAAAMGDTESVKTAAQVVRWMVDKGWDDEYGGLYQFVGINGEKPAGQILETNAADHMIVELKENWSNKLWWVHSEALYALILAYEHTRDAGFLDSYWKVHNYTFGTFPNPNHEVGEWIQIRDRQGKPDTKVVALPVKDPYHITRAFMHTIKALERIEQF